MNPGSLLTEVAAASPETEAFAEGDRRVSYGEWDRLSNEAAGAFLSMGLRAGDVVALMLPTGIEYPVAYLGALKAGLVTAGVNPRYKTREVAHILANSGAAVLVAPRGELRDVAEAAASPVLRDIVDPSRLRGDPLEEAHAYGRGDAAAIVYTSGTTGLPKGATYTAGCLEKIREIESTAGVHRAPRVLAAVPLPHMAFMTKIASTIERRSFTVLADRWSARLALETIERERLTDTGGIPTQITLMLMDPEFDRFDLSSIKYVTIGGAPASPDLVRAVREKFKATVIVRYSCTEVGLATGTRPRDADDVVARTVGRPLPGVDVEIQGEAPGEILVRSQAMMRGYWNDPEATRAAIDDRGFFHTGDIGWVDEDGNLHISGRAKDMYIRGGYNVYPAEVEAVLREHPAVAMAAVIGVPDPVLGERGKAFVVPRDGEHVPSVEDLRAFVIEQIADYKAPDEIEFRAELPMSATFKVDKAALTGL